MSAARNVITVIAINFVAVLVLLGIVDLIFGEWLKPKPPVSAVPSAIWDKRITYDVSGLYGVTKPLVIEYSRDDRGYRGLQGNENKKVILTIGGSTTDQRFVTDGEDWQSKINRQIPKDYSVVNGGVDGQSSYGHLFSIRNWHSKELHAPQISLVVYYFGVNDAHLLLRGGKGLNEYDNLYKGAGLLRKIRIAFSRNSFIYAKMRLAKNNLFRETGAVDQGVVWGGHSHRDTPFNDNGNVYPIQDPAGLSGFRYYTELIQKLINETRVLFPFAEVMFVQQQIPGCRFVSEQQVIDRQACCEDGSKQIRDQTEDNQCVTLGQVYLAQMQAISGLGVKSRPRVVKMYLSKIIQDDGVYDYVHTTPIGNSQIADYLSPFIVEAISR